MDFKIDITKRLLVRLAMVLVLVSAAVLFDVYVDDNPVEFEKIQTESKEHSTDQSSLCFIAQTSSLSIKTAGEKAVDRKFKVQLHDKYLRKYHQLRNNQVLQAEHSTQTAPIIQSYHYLVFQHYFFTQPDEDSLA